MIPRRDAYGHLLPLGDWVRWVKFFQAYNELRSHLQLVYVRP